MNRKNLSIIIMSCSILLGLFISYLCMQSISIPFLIFAILLTISFRFLFYRFDIRYQKMLYLKKLRTFLYHGKYRELWYELSLNEQNKKIYFEFYLLALFHKGELKTFQQIYKNHMNEIHEANTLERYILCLFHDIMGAIQSNKKTVRFLQDYEKKYPYQKSSYYFIYQNISLGLRAYFKKDVEMTKSYFDTFFIQSHYTSPILAFQLYFLITYLMQECNHSKYQTYLNFTKSYIYDKISMQLLTEKFHIQMNSKEVPIMENEFSRAKRNQHLNHQQPLRRHAQPLSPDSSHEAMNHITLNQQMNHSVPDYHSNANNPSMQPMDQNELDPTWFIRQNNSNTQSSYTNQHGPNNAYSMPNNSTMYTERKYPNYNNTQSQFHSNLNQNQESLQQTCNNTNNAGQEVIYNPSKNEIPPTPTQSQANHPQFAFRKQNVRTTLPPLPNHTSEQQVNASQSIQRPQASQSIQNSQLVQPSQPNLQQQGLPKIVRNTQTPQTQNNVAANFQNMKPRDNFNSMQPNQRPTPRPTQSIQNQNAIKKQTQPLKPQSVIEPTNIPRNEKDQTFVQSMETTKLRREASFFKKYIRMQKFMFLVVFLDSILLTIMTSSLIYTTFLNEYLISESIVKNILQFDIILVIAVTYITLGAHTGYTILHKKLVKWSRVMKFVLSPLLLLAIISIGLFAEIPYYIYANIKSKQAS